MGFGYCMVESRIEQYPDLLQCKPMSASATYPPSTEFVQRARVQGLEGYRALYDRAAADPEGFWGELAKQELHWFQPWSRVLDADNAPFSKWFTAAKPNVSYNCVDRHAEGPLQNKPAIVWEGEPGDQRVITFGELKSLVGRF